MISAAMTAETKKKADGDFPERHFAQRLGENEARHRRGRLFCLVGLRCRHRRRGALLQQYRDRGDRDDQDETAECEIACLPTVVRDHATDQHRCEDPGDARAGECHTEGEPTTAVEPDVDRSRPDDGRRSATDQRQSEPCGIEHAERTFQLRQRRIHERECDHRGDADAARTVAVDDRADQRRGDRRTDDEETCRSGYLATRPAERGGQRQHEHTKRVERQAAETRTVADGRSQQRTPAALELECSGRHAETPSGLRNRW